MIIDVTQTTVERQDILRKLCKWLGEDGISFFREIKDKYGRVDACWEIFPGVPHPVHWREGMQVRNFLRTIFGSSWTAHDYDTRWMELVDEAIGGTEKQAAGKDYEA